MVVPVRRPAAPPVGAAPRARPGSRHGGDQDASTRQRVAGSILQHGPSTASELAARLGMTAAGVRRHLDTLVEEGRVEAREQRVYGARGRGRPAKVFVLTEAGRGDFYTSYDDLAIDALGYLTQVGGESAVADFARRRIAGVEARYAELTTEAGPELSPAQALARALSDAGYIASVTPSAHGEQICQHHCPVAKVAEQFPQLCAAETEAFSRLLGVHVQRLATIAHGDAACTTHVPDPVRIDRALAARGRPAPPESAAHDDQNRPQPRKAAS